MRRRCGLTGGGGAAPPEPPQGGDGDPRSGCALRTRDGGGAAPLGRGWHGAGGLRAPDVRPTHDSAAHPRLEMPDDEGCLLAILRALDTARSWTDPMQVVPLIPVARLGGTRRRAHRNRSAR